MEHRTGRHRIAAGVICVLAIGGIAPIAVRAAEEPSTWWSFRPVRRPEVPAGTHPIDALVRVAQQARGVSMSPEADRTTLIRRLSFDLRGLPPSPAEVDAFVADPRADSFERLVDAYLASPAFGVRWATPWLDLARYADTAGFEDDARRPNAYRYRDWVVDALNRDMPYDRFVRLQLAANEVEPDAPAEKAALGFLRNGPSVGNERGDRVRADELDDVVSTTTSVFLGLTVGCARCHDHKADPISIEDYARLVAVFAPARPADVPLATAAEVADHRQLDRAADARLDAALVDRLAITRPARDPLEAARRSGLPARWREALDAGTVRGLAKDEQVALEASLTVTDYQVVESLSPADQARVRDLDRLIAGIARDRPPPLPVSPGVVEATSRAAPSRVYFRGDLARPGPIVAAGTPRGIDGRGADFPQPGPSATTTGRRAALARWIADPGNPLTARVEVNRIWRGHFGDGLVATPGDFGATGEAPSIPPLLDWLASELVERGWSRKAIHRLIVTSATYRQSSRHRPEMARIDPAGPLLWRYPLRRLDAETIRDAILAAAGTLDEARGGPGVYPAIDPAIVKTGNIPRWPLDARDGPLVWRRSLYVNRMRSVRVPLLEVFDQPDAARSCPSRETTTQPSQALSLLNDPFVVDQAGRFADRVAREAGPDPATRIELAFRIATGRRPTAAQLSEALAYLAGPGDLAGLCHVLFNASVFLYVE